MLTDILIIFLALAIVLYCLFGGADFGAGILELIVRKHDWKLIDQAIAPVWEANHVWLVLVVVILFVGFPPIYATVGQFLHIPLILLLVGIILRGTAFTFRHYDAKHEWGTRRAYNLVFRLSSLLATLFLGVIVGAVIMGRITPEPASFYEGYIAPWLNVFSFTVGLFTVCLFSFLASVYLMGEARLGRERAVLVRASKILALAAVLSGGLVFMEGEFSSVYLLSRFIYSPVAIVSVLVSALLLPVLWRSLSREKVWQSRILAGAELVLVLVAWFDVQSPVVVAMRNNASLTFRNSAAGGATQLQLVIALAVGSLLILPGILYLMKVFKGQEGYKE